MIRSTGETICRQVMISIDSNKRKTDKCDDQDRILKPGESSQYISSRDIEDDPVMVSGRINRDLHAAAAVQLLCTVKEIFPGILVRENQGTMACWQSDP